MAEVVYPPVIGVARVVFAGLGLRFHLEGTEHVPRHGGAVMAINHVGYLDFTFAGLAARPARRLVRFMAKQEVFHHRVAGPLMRGMHHIPVDRDSGAGSYGAAIAALRAGEIVGVFPEATISRSYELKDFKRGAARMAIESGAPLLPVVVWGSQRVMTKGRPRNLRRANIPITVLVGEPIVAGSGDDAGALTATLREVMTGLLHHAQDTYPQRPAGADDAWWLPTRLGGTAPTPEEAKALDVAEAAARRQARAEAARRAREGGAGTGR